MKRQQIKEILQITAGRVEAAFGALSDDAKLQLRGHAKRFARKIRAKTADTVDIVRSAATRKPIGTVLLAASAAFLLSTFCTSPAHILTGHMRE